MMMTLARRFEGLQNSFPFSWATDSGFSGEDLVLDLLGFYRVVACMSGIFSHLKPVSQADALRRWDHYGKIGSWKNETFKPLLFLTLFNSLTPNLTLVSYRSSCEA